MSGYTKRDPVNPVLCAGEALVREVQSRASPGAPGIPGILSASRRRGEHMRRHKEPGEEAEDRQQRLREGGKHPGTQARCGGLRMRGAEGEGHTQPIVSG